MTQRDAVARILRERGHVHTFELRQGIAGQMIGNPSQRIAELEAEGWRFEHSREKLHGQATGTRYRLVSTGDVERGTVPSAPVDGAVQAGHVPLSAEDDVQRERAGITKLPGDAPDLCPGLPLSAAENDGRLFDLFDVDVPARRKHYNPEAA